MNYQTFESLIKDWENSAHDIKLHFVTQGHIQCGDTFYTKLPEHADNIIENYGYGDVWQEYFPQKIGDIPRYSNPVIAASCGSWYGVPSSKKKYTK